MIGAYAVGKKAVTFGYKRYGVPGAVAAGGLALAGYVVVRRALRSATDDDEDALDSAIDPGAIESAVEERGLGAVTDVGTLEEAIDADELRSAVDVDDVRSSAAEEAGEFSGDHAGDE